MTHSLASIDGRGVARALSASGIALALACSSADDGASPAPFVPTNDQAQPQAGDGPDDPAGNADSADADGSGPAGPTASEGGPDSSSIDADGLDTGSDDGASSGNDPSAAQPAGFGQPVMTGSGQSSGRYANSNVSRDGQSYFFMANGWGPGFDSQTVSWNGTSFTVESMQGEQGPQYQPASYPTVFCGEYSDSRSGECGLPAALSDVASLRTGWSWRPNGNDGEYNAAYDIWMGTSLQRSSFSGYLMVWLREPAGQQPAGSRTLTGVTVQNVPGSWDIWTGSVNNRPIINWVRAEGDDTLELEFDVLDFVRDAQARDLELPGDHVLSVAVGFEIWNGPIQNLESLDFYVDVQ